MEPAHLRGELGYVVGVPYWGEYLDDEAFGILRTEWTAGKPPATPK